MRTDSVVLPIQSLLKVHEFYTLLYVYYELMSPSLQLYHEIDYVRYVVFERVTCYIVPYNELFNLFN